MYERFYELRERPFSLTPDPDYLYLSHSHTQALSRLRHGLAGSTNLLVLTGEIGSGKTLLLHTAVRTLDPRTSVAWIVNTQLDARELVEAIVLGFGLEPPPDSSEARLTECLVRFLTDEQEAGRRALLIIDEAQNLGLLALDRLLIALEASESPLLRIVLVGQPSLGDLLRAKELQRLKGRIGIRYHLRGLDAADTEAYINHRLRQASSGDAMEFPKKVSELIYRHSGGVPRRINVLSDTVLLHAYGEGRRTIGLDIARVALGELERSGAQPPLGLQPLVEKAIVPDVEDFSQPEDPIAVPARPESRPLREEVLTVSDLSLVGAELTLRTPGPPAHPLDDFEWIDAPHRKTLLRSVAAIAAVLVMTVVAATLGFRNGAGGGRPGEAGGESRAGAESRPGGAGTAGGAGEESTAAQARGIGRVEGAVSTPERTLLAADLPPTAATANTRPATLEPEPPSQARTQPAPTTGVAPSLLANREDVPMPPLSQRAAASPVGAPTRTDVASASDRDADPRPLILPPVAEASTQALPVVPVPRTGPSLPVPPRAPTVAPPAAASLPASVASAPAASSTLAAAPSALAAAALDEQSVRAVVNQYRAAFSALDAGAAKAVWPSLDARALDRAFGQLQSQDIQFDGCRVSVAGSRATVACGGRAQFVPKVGDRTPRQEPRSWTFDLQKSNTEWTIQRVQAR